MKEKWFIIMNQMDQIQLISSTKYHKNQLQLLLVVVMVFMQCVHLYSCPNICHPWWLVKGSIPLMTSYGHGLGC